MPALDDDARFGVKAIDDEHRHLLSFIEMAAKIAPENRPRLATERFLASMRGLLLSHFNNEEDLMSIISYPDTQQHMGDHSCMLSTYDVLLFDYKSHGDGAAIITYLMDWITTHLNANDRDLRRYLHSLRQERRAPRRPTAALPATASALA